MSPRSSMFYIKTNRVFNNAKKYTWILVPLIALGGLFYPKLGLLVIPIMFTIMFLGFFKGKYWCGNICPHGSLFDRIMLPVGRNVKIPGLLKSRTLRVLFFTWYMYMFIQRVIKVSALWGSLAFLDKLGFVFAFNYLIPTTIGVFLALFVNTRAWCSFCPMGTIQQVTYKLGKLTGLNKKTDQRVTVAATEMCHKCGKCSRVCPMQLKPYLEFSDKNQFDNENCIRCSTCVANCPAGILSLQDTENAEKVRRSISLKGYETRKRFAAVVENIVRLTDDIVEYAFKFDPRGQISYDAGQFILVKIMDNPEMFRAYSVSGFDKRQGIIKVTIKVLKNGFGTTLIHENFKVGDTVELEGPLGSELTIDKNADKVLLIAGGIGITPFVPMVKDLLENSKVKGIKLIYGVTKENEFIYDDYFHALVSGSSRFEYLKTVADPGPEWKGHRGFVTNITEQMDLEGYKVYMCGPPSMARAAKKLLLEKGVQEQDIFIEAA